MDNPFAKRDENWLPWLGSSERATMHNEKTLTERWVFVVVWTVLIGVTVAALIFR